MGSWSQSVHIGHQQGNKGELYFPTQVGVGGVVQVMNS